MRLLYHLGNQRILTYHIEHMWPMSEKVKKLIPTNKLIVKDASIEDYGWPPNNKKTNKSKQESVSYP